ncbi:MAG: RICIN domain-containing protein [Chloroflexi bacterium]|nr:RICIN domain-containing protein [Chloroflexota bacterium]
MKSIQFVFIGLCLFLLSCDVQSVVTGLIGQPTPTLAPFNTLIPNFSATDASIKGTQTAIAQTATAGNLVQIAEANRNATQTAIARAATSAELTRIATPKYFRLINHHSQLCLTASTNGSSVFQASCTGSDSQLWEVPNDSGSFRIVAKNGRCLASSGIDTVQSSCNASPIWTLITWGNYQQTKSDSPGHPTNFPHNHAVLVTGIYFEINAGGNCVDADQYNHDEGGRIIYFECKGRAFGNYGGDNDNQLWARY